MFKIYIHIDIALSWLRDRVAIKQSANSNNGVGGGGVGVFWDSERLCESEEEQEKFIFAFQLAAHLLPKYPVGSSHAIAADLLGVFHDTAKYWFSFMSGSSCFERMFVFTKSSSDDSTFDSTSCSSTTASTTFVLEALGGMSPGLAAQAMEIIFSLASMVPGESDAGQSLRDQAVRLLTKHRVIIHHSTTTTTTST